MGYQTEHYVIKVVSFFGRLVLWNRPGYKKARILVRVLINEVALCPYSLVVKRFTDISSLGRSWSVHVYIIDGFPPSPTIIGDEDPVPPMGAGPHPTQLPFLTVMQHAAHDQQSWELQNADVQWEKHVGQQRNNNGWGSGPWSNMYLLLSWGLT